jgi:hypothetical protein
LWHEAASCPQETASAIFIHDFLKFPLHFRICIFS